MMHVHFRSLLGHVTWLIRVFQLEGRFSTEANEISYSACGASLDQGPWQLLFHFWGSIERRFRDPRRTAEDLWKDLFSTATAALARQLETWSCRTS